MGERFPSGWPSLYASPFPGVRPLGEFQFPGLHCFGSVTVRMRGCSVSLDTLHSSPASRTSDTGLGHLQTAEAMGPFWISELVLQNHSRVLVRVRACVRMCFTIPFSSGTT